MWGSDPIRPAASVCAIANAARAEKTLAQRAQSGDFPSTAGALGECKF